MKMCFGQKNQLNSRKRQEIKYYFIIILDNQKRCLLLFLLKEFFLGLENSLVVKHLSLIHKALNSIPSTERKKRRKKSSQNKPYYLEKSLTGLSIFFLVLITLS